VSSQLEDDLRDEKGEFTARGHFFENINFGFSAIFAIEILVNLYANWCSLSLSLSVRLSLYLFLSLSLFLCLSVCLVLSSSKS
jgi:hypothetical protein